MMILVTLYTALIGAVELDALFFNGNVLAWVRERAPILASLVAQTSTYALVVIGLLALSLCGALLLWQRAAKLRLASEERTKQLVGLKSQLGYLGIAKYLDVNAVARGRSMQGCYCQLQRSLLSPPEHRPQPDQEPGSRINDADKYFATMLRDQRWRSLRTGFLIEGAPLLGKTRFVMEWLIHNNPEDMVVILRPQTIPITLIEVLKIQSKAMVHLILDDLQRFEHDVSSIMTLVKAIQSAGGVPVIWATVRSGSAYGTFGTGAFNDFRVILDVKRLGLLTPTQSLDVAAANNIEISSSTDTDRTFSFLLHLDFEEKLRTYLALSYHARQLLRMAAMLDIREITIDWPMCDELAQNYIPVQAATDVSQCLSELRQHYFLLEDDQPESGYLKNVVDVSDIRIDAFDRSLLVLLKERRDGHALAQWGSRDHYEEPAENTVVSANIRLAPEEILEFAAELIQDEYNDQLWLGHVRYNQGNAFLAAGNTENALTAYLKAESHFQILGTPEASGQIARSMTNRGFVLRRAGLLEGAINVYKTVETFAEQHPTPETQVQSIKAAYQRALTLDSLNRHIEAIAALDKSAHTGLASDDEDGYFGAAVSSIAKADIHEAMEQWDASIDAIVTGEHACEKSSLNSMRVMCAEFRIVRAYRLRNRMRFEEAVNVYLLAESIGEASEQPNGLEQCARSARCRGNTLGFELNRLKDSITAYLDAEDFGLRSGTPGGLQHRAEAAVCRGVSWGRLGDYARQTEAYVLGEQAALQSGTPDALVQAAQAAYNLSISFGEDERESVQLDASARAIEAGVASDQPLGQLIAVQAAYNRGVVLHEVDAAAAIASYEQAESIAEAVEKSEALVLASRCANNRALILMARNDEHTAQEVLESASRFGEASGLDEGQVQAAIAYNALARLAQTQSATNDSLVFSEKAEQMGIDSNTPEGATEAGSAANRTGVLLQSTNQPAAYDAFMRAKDVGISVGTAEGLTEAARAAHHQGLLQLSLEHGDEAVTLFQEASNLAVNIGAIDGALIRAQATIELARIAESRGQRENAERLYLLTQQLGLYSESSVGMSLREEALRALQTMLRTSMVAE